MKLEKHGISIVLYILVKYEQNFTPPFWLIRQKSYFGPCKLGSNGFRRRAYYNNYRIRSPTQKCDVLQVHDSIGRTFFGQWTYPVIIMSSPDRASSIFNRAYHLRTWYKCLNSLFALCSPHELYVNVLNLKVTTNKVYGFIQS